MDLCVFVYRMPWMDAVWKVNFAHPPRVNTWSIHIQIACVHYPDRTQSRGRFPRICHGFAFHFGYKTCTSTAIRATNPFTKALPPLKFQHA